jgi:hypothetical protein
VLITINAPTGGALFHVMVDSLHESPVAYTSSSTFDEGLAAVQYSFNIAEEID